MVANIEKERAVFHGTDRFVVKRHLGAGGFGAVYQVYDKKSDQMIALKTLHKNNAEAIYYLKQEFRALTDVTHPNLASLFELLSEYDQWFFTMELIEGVNFLEYVWEKEAPKEEFQSMMSTMKSPILNGKNVTSIVVKPKVTRQHLQLNLTRLRESLKQLSEGIYALHEEKKLHRDLKPSNVMITRSGQVKVLDFGLVREMASFQNQFNINDDEIVGTPSFMSPEQATGKTLTVASDWYSLGIMIYQALTGILPHTGSLHQILKSKLTGDPIAPKKLFPHVPEDLSELCMDMLQRDPEARPGGLEILCRLSADSFNLGLSSPLSGPLLINSAAPVSKTTTTVAPFIGRQEQLQTLKQAYQDAENGKSVTVYIHGSSGMGKSTLAKQFLSELQQSDKALIFSSRCYQQESVPYKAFDNIIDALSRYLKHLSEKSQLPEIKADIPALVRIFPILQQVTELEKFQNSNLNIRSTQELRRRAFNALRELLAAVSRDRCLVLFIDDLQWGDIDSAALLAELLRPPKPLPMLLLATYRSEEAETSPMLRTLLPLCRQGELAATINEIVVSEFSASEARELVATLMGVQPTEQHGQAEAIVRESGGSPFFIGELARYSMGGLDLTQLSNNKTENLAASLNSVIRHRVSHLPEQVRALLEVITVAGQPIKLKIAKQAVKFTSGDQAALLNLRAQHLIRIRETDGEEELEPYHDRIRETIVDNLSPASLQSYHCQLADVLEQHGNADAEQLMKHFYKGELLEKASHYALLAGGKANIALAFDQAAQCYRIALDIFAQKPALTTSAELHNTEVKLGEALTNAGRGMEAAQAFLKAIDTAENDREIVDLQRRSVEQFLTSGHIDEGLNLGAQVLEKFGLKIPATRKWALFYLILNHIKLRWRGFNFPFRNNEDITQDELMRIDACWSVTLGLSNVDTIRAAYIQSHNLLCSLSTGEPYRIARALAFEAAYTAAAGKTAETRVENLLSRASKIADQINNPHAIALTNFITGFSHFLVGRWRKAYQFDMAAEKMFREQCTGVRWELDGAHVNALHSQLFLGEWSQILQIVPGYIRDAVDHGDLYGETIMRCRIAYYGYLIQDEPEKAKRELKIVIDRWSHQEFYQQHFWVVLGQAEVAIYTGDGEWAWKHLNEQTRILKNSFTLRTQFFRILWWNIRARSAILAAKNNRDKSLIVEAEKCARLIAKEQTDYGQPFAEQIQAGIASYRGNIDQAIKYLEKAEKGFVNAEMYLHAQGMRYQRGRLIGKTAGEILINEAIEWMNGESIKNPAKIAKLLAPIVTRKE